MTNLITEWRFSPIKGYEDYLICDDGSAFTLKRGKKLNLKPSQKQLYLRIRVRHKKKERYLWAHRVVASHFIGDVTNMEVHHNDNDPRNNYHGNLKIVTKRENLDFRNQNQGWNI